MKNHSYSSIILVVIIMVLSACAPAAAPYATEIAIVEAPTNTALPTNTLLPPTRTPVPFTPTPRPILPTITSVFIRANGSVFTIGDSMYVVFGRFDEAPVYQNNMLTGKFFIEGDPANVPISALIPGQLSVGKYEGSFAGDNSWQSGTAEDLMQLFQAGDLIEMRIPIGFLPDNDKVLAELANANWAALTADNLYLNPAMVGVVVK